MDIIPLFATAVNLVIFFMVIELVRRNRLKERYSLLWIFASVVMFWFSVSRQSLHFVAGLIGIQYPPSLIFLIGLIFMVLINIHFSTVISELSEKNKTLVQDLALLADRVNEMGSEKK
ncbi:MAG: DUF2304 domain-containing protein [Nitrospirae bacterium]|nr:DUF2304 domain-containing protein [Nitrospirota bacterium]